MAPANRARPYTYNVSSNGAAGDWYWEATNRGEIIARGLAATATLARADAMRAALSHLDPRPENLPPYLEDPLPPLPRFGGSLGDRFWSTQRPKAIGTTACLRHWPPILSRF